MNRRLSEAQNTVSWSDVIFKIGMLLKTNLGIRSRQYYRQHGGFVYVANRLRVEEVRVCIVLKCFVELSDSLNRSAPLPPALDVCMCVKISFMIHSIRKGQMLFFWVCSFWF